MFSFQALCSNGQLTNTNGACNKYYLNDGITHRDYTVVRYSGGTCMEPNKCDCCNTGFYADNHGFCKSKNKKMESRKILQSHNFVYFSFLIIHWNEI